VAVEFLCDFMERRRHRPFYAYYASKIPHCPHVATPDSPPGEVELYREAFARFVKGNTGAYDEYLRSEAERRGIELTWRSAKEYRRQMIAYLDKTTGRLLAKLDELGIREETLVVFASDNGNSEIAAVREGVETFPGRKGDSRDGGTRVPLIANWPGTIAPGRTCDDMIHVQDFLPTFYELAGARPPSVLDGVSFAPQLLGRKGEPREYVVGTGAHPSVWLERVRKELGLPDMEAYPLSWIRGRRYKLYSDGRFYDLKTDYAEARRIAPGRGAPEAEAARKRLNAVLEAHRAKAKGR
jgi:arylsulfatase A